MFESAMKLHQQSPLTLKQICLNDFEKNWHLWILACEQQNENLLEKLCKFFYGHFYMEPVA